jgi:ESCRT-I complex subunit VPS28
MLKLVGDEVQSVDQFMNRYRVRMRLIITSDGTDSDGKMDHPAALQRIRVGVPATVEHSSEAGPETAKWVAETTQVGHHTILFHDIALIQIYRRVSSRSWMH